MKKVRKILSMLLVCCMVAGMLPTFALATGQDYVWLDELQIVDSDRYTGNMGDSFIDKIGTRNGTIDTVGNRYSHGLEAWIARWNYKNESSWAWCTYDLNGKYDTLSGTIGILAGSYNKTNFDTTLEIWGDNVLLYSLALHPNMTNQDVILNVVGVDTLKISLYDNESASGGTSFLLGDFRLYDDVSKPLDESSDKNNVDFNQKPDDVETEEFSFQGHTYQVFDESLTWEDAKASCEAKGGHLATITSNKEQEFIGQLIEDSEKDFYWLGGTDSENEGQWKWVTGEFWTYENWGSGQPNNNKNGHSENYLAMIRTKQHWNGYTQNAFEWNDFSNQDANLIGYICEWDEPTVGGFIDVHESDYFAPYVLWAVDNGVTNGTSINTFSPHDTCTVAQILTFLWRAKGASDPGIANPFSDVKEGDYFYRPALWAYQSGLISGDIFVGDKPCTRAMTVLYLWILAGKPSAGDSPFSDVPTHADYAQAVAWAVNQGVTTGTSATTFSPNQTCTRAQIVTFLYRYISLNLPELNANEVNIYAGPGENYQFVGKIEESEIREYIREENNWIEVEYQNRRVYVRESSLTNLEIALLPYVASAPIVGPTQRPYVVFFSGLERELTCETPIRSGPGSSYAKIDTLESGTTLKILYENQSSTNININPFLLVEYQTSEGLKRGYAERNTVLDIHNPLRGFDKVKESNSAFDYQGNTYYSTAAYPHSLDGWTTQYSDSLVDYQFNFLAAITGAISSNDSDIDLVEETWLYNSKADAYVAVNKNSIQNANAFIDLFGIVNTFFASGNQNMAIQVDLETYEDEGRLIIRGGIPFESQYAGKKNLSLSSLIAQNGSALDVLESDKRVDELIRSICPEITGDAQCTLLLTFSNDFADNPYGYYFVVDKSGRVYSQIIIHPGTQFNVYQQGQLITDIAPRISGTLMELDTETGDRIIEILSNNGILRK